MALILSALQMVAVMDASRSGHATSADLTSLELVCLNLVSEHLRVSAATETNVAQVLNSVVTDAYQRSLVKPEIAYASNAELLELVVSMFPALASSVATLGSVVPDRISVMQDVFLSSPLSGSAYNAVLE